MNLLRIISTACVLAVSTHLLKAEADISDPPAPKEDLGYDIFEGKTNKIDHVMQADPRFVWVLYENDAGSRRIPRNDLPPILAAKYPYDAKKAADFVNEKSAEVQRAHAGDIALQKKTLELREQNLLSQIKEVAAKKKDVDNQLTTVTKEIATTAKKRKAGFRTEKVDLLKQQGDLRDQMEKLQDQLRDTRTQLDALP